MSKLGEKMKAAVSDVSKGLRIGIGFSIAVGLAWAAVSYGASLWSLPTAWSWSTVTSAAWNEVVSHVNQIANKPGLRIKKAYTALVTGITYHAITPTNTYAIPVTLPSDTKGVILGVRYLHAAGTASHGYLDFKAYQQNATATEDKATYVAYHYNDYYNSDYTEIIVPWNNSGNGNSVTIQTTDSYNSNAANTYEIYFAGYIADS